MRHILLLLFALAVSLPTPAWALSCAPPEMNRQVIDQHDVIFTGTLSGDRDLTAEEQRAFTASGLTAKAPSVENVRAFDMLVSQSWKGVQSGQRITVLRNTYWGDGFAPNYPYLVVAQQVGNTGLYFARLCGNTMVVTGEFGRKQLNELRSVMGNGVDIKVKPEDTACVRDDNCGIVRTSCGGCDCGVPVHIKYQEKYRQQLKEACAPPRKREQCNLSCIQIAPQCVHGYCSFEGRQE